MIDYARIQKDCFWDLNISKEEIDVILGSKDMRKKSMLFDKILLNSTRLFVDLKIFDKKQIAQLIESYKLPKFNEQYAFRRKNMIEVYFLDKPLLIDELKWVA